MAVVTIHTVFGAQENKVYFGFNYSLLPILNVLLESKSASALYKITQNRQGKFAPIYR